MVNNIKIKVDGKWLEVKSIVTRNGIYYPDEGEIEEVDIKHKGGSEMKTFKQGKHIKDCCSVRNVKDGTWGTSWVVPEYDWIKSNILGKRGRPTKVPVLIFYCNDTRCQARLIVEIKEMSKLLPTT